MSIKHRQNVFQNTVKTFSPDTCGVVCNYELYWQRVGARLNNRTAAHTYTRLGFGSAHLRLFSLAEVSGMSVRKATPVE